MKDVVAPEIEALGFKVQWMPMQSLDGRAGDLVAEHPCPAGTRKCGKRLLLIGHMDTVFEPSSSFQRYSIVPGTNGNVATGPGVIDMKGGLVVMLTALKAMKAAGTLDNAEIRIVLSGDEERHGEPTSVSEEGHDRCGEAERCGAGVREHLADRWEGHGADCAAELDYWELETSGRSGHSSQIFRETMGYGAIYELARILDAFRKELPEPGLTFNVGLVLGGATAKMNEDEDRRRGHWQNQRDSAGCAGQWGFSDAE